MTMLSPPKKILIVDDHPSVRDGLSLRIALHADLEVCGEADSEDEAFTLVKQLAPDLVLIDISLKIGNGIELLKRIRSYDPAIKMLVVSGFQDSLYAERACRAGALSSPDFRPSQRQAMGTGQCFGGTQPGTPGNSVSACLLICSCICTNIWRERSM